MTKICQGCLSERLTALDVKKMLTLFDLVPPYQFFVSQIFKNEYFHLILDLLYGKGPIRCAMYVFSTSVEVRLGISLRQFSTSVEVRVGIVGS